VQLNDDRKKSVKTTFGHVDAADSLVLDYPEKVVDALLYSIKERRMIYIEEKSTKKSEQSNQLTDKKTKKLKKVIENEIKLNKKSHRRNRLEKSRQGKELSWMEVSKYNVEENFLGGNN